MRGAKERGLTDVVCRDGGGGHALPRPVHATHLATVSRNLHPIVFCSPTLFLFYFYLLNQRLFVDTGKNTALFSSFYLLIFHEPHKANEAAAKRKRKTNGRQHSRKAALEPFTLYSDVLGTYQWHQNKW